VTAVDLLCWISAGGALLGAGAYVYGYIIKPRGDRRWHTASLLFSGFALANLPLVLRHGAEGPGMFNGAVLVAFLLLGMGCQIPIAFRQRRSDSRRAADAVPATPGIAGASPPRARRTA
jgi:peptidoglycan/LPS O-acetylase OafA/YrhL